MPPKPVLEIDMAEFRTMQKLMIKAQDKAKEIRHLQDTVLPKLKQQLADTKGIFKGKERKALTEQIQRTEKEIAEKLDKLPDVLKEDGYPDVQAYMATYRKAEAVVEQFNRDLAAWEQQVREKQKPAKKEQAKPPERESVLKRLRQLQAEGKQRNQPRQRKKSFDRDSGSVKNFVALVKNGSFLVRITDMTILIEKEFIYGSSKRPNPTDYYRKQHYQCG